MARDQDIGSRIDRDELLKCGQKSFQHERRSPVQALMDVTVWTTTERRVVESLEEVAIFNPSLEIDCATKCEYDAVLGRIKADPAGGGVGFDLRDRHVRHARELGASGALPIFDVLRGAVRDLGVIDGIDGVGVVVGLRGGEGGEDEKEKSDEEGDLDHHKKEVVFFLLEKKRKKKKHFLKNDFFSEVFCDAYIFLSRHLMRTKEGKAK